MTHSYDRRALLFALAAAPAIARAAPAGPVLTARLDSPNTGRQGPLAPMQTEASLTGAAVLSARYFGAAVRIDQLRSDPALETAVRRDCAYLVPEIHLNWNSIEWNKGQYNFDPIDQLLDFADLHSLKVRGHTLIWNPSTPDWAIEEMLRHKDWRLISDYFGRVMGRYQDRIDEWEVVNEPVDTETGANGLRLTAFHQAFGPTYIERALEEARARAPSARLLINEYGFDYDNPVDQARRETFIQLLRRLKASGVPLDGVGVQAHLDLAKGPLKPQIVTEFLQRIADLGLDITITEMDVKECDYQAPIAQRDRLVADETKRYLDAALLQPAVRGVVTWGISDRYSWLSEGDGAGHPAEPGAPALPLNRGLPYAENYAPKPMYWTIQRSLLGSSLAGVAYRSPTSSA